MTTNKQIQNSRIHAEQIQDAKPIPIQARKRSTQCLYPEHSTTATAAKTVARSHVLTITTTSHTTTICTPASTSPGTTTPVPSNRSSTPTRPITSKYAAQSTIATSQTSVSAAACQLSIPQSPIAIATASNNTNVHLSIQTITRRPSNPLYRNKAQPLGLGQRSRQRSRSPTLDLASI